MVGTVKPAVSGYGLSPLRVIPAVRETVGLFDQIYALQDTWHSLTVCFARHRGEKSPYKWGKNQSLDIF